MKERYVKSGYPSMKIDRNVISFDDTILQMDNISSVQETQDAPAKYPGWVFIMALVGGWLVWQDAMEFGWTLLIVAATIFLGIWYKNAIRAEYLGIFMNSGEVYLISYRNRDFAYKAMKEIAEGMNWKNGNAVINFKDCNIEQFVQGNYVENLSIETWNQIENIWTGALQESEVGTKEYSILSEAQRLIEKRTAVVWWHFCSVTKMLFSVV